jgi:hypothetical protein
MRDSTQAEKCREMGRNASFDMFTNTFDLEMKGAIVVP